MDRHRQRPSGAIATIRAMIVGRGPCAEAVFTTASTRWPGVRLVDGAAEALLAINADAHQVVILALGASTEAVDMLRTMRGPGRASADAITLVLLPRLIPDDVEGLLSIGAADVALEASDSASVTRLLLVAERHVLERVRRLRALELARARERRLDAVFEGTLDAMVLATSGGHVLEANRAAAEILGVAAGAEGVGTLPGWLVPALGEVTRTPADLPLRFPDAGPLHRDLEVTVTRLPDAGVILLVARDVTDANRLRDRLVVANRLGALGLMSASLAHEFNNPLACALASVQYLEGVVERAGDPQASEAATDALASLDRMRLISQDLRIFARGDAGPSRSVDLRQSVESAVRLARHQTIGRATVEVAIDGDPRVLGTEAGIGQVFLNLIVNAAQAMPPGGSASHRIVVRARVEGEWVAADVEDDGPGIPPDVMARLFTPLFTTKAAGEGTGLGLWIVQQLVRSTGGDVTIESAPGRGTTVHLRLRTAR